MNEQWMIYGANGYTGQLITREAVKRGHSPMLAGRNEQEIHDLANELDLEYRIFDLTENIMDQITGMHLVLNCAGPFTKTVAPILNACLEVKCHYLDLSGELSVFEYCFNKNKRAQEQGCIVCPGVAFDIVPTEAVAVKLKHLLPDADTIKLGFDGQMSLSKGSSMTLLEGVGNKDLSVYMVRDNGEVQALSKPRIENHSFEFNKPAKKAMAITWADLNGAFYSTNVPNISVFIPATVVNRLSFAYMTWLKPMFSLKIIQNFFEKVIKMFIKGPSGNELDNRSMVIFGEAHNTKGESKRVYIKVAHGYKFTYLASISIVEACLHQQDKSGYFTPSMLMGVDFIEGLEGSSRFQVV